MSKFTIRILTIASIGSFFVLVFSFAIFGIQDTDVAQYLASGQYIAQHQTIPAANIFAYPNALYGMVWDEWLFHLIVYGIYSLAGFAGLAVFQIIIVAAIFALLFFIGRRRARLAVLLPILLITLLAAHERFMLRADLLSLLFVAIYIYILEKYQQEKTKLIYVLPFLQLIWANFHGFWILGIIIMAIYVFSDLVKKNISKSIIAILVSSIIVCFINPYGVSGFKVPFERLIELKTTHSILLETNADFYGPFSDTREARHLPVLAYKILLLASLVILLAQIKKISLCYALLYTAFLLMSLNFIRNIPMFAVVVAFILPKTLDGLVARIKIRLSPKKFDIAYFLILIAFIGSAIFLSYELASNKFYLREGRTRRFGLELNALVFPAKALEFVKENKLAGPLFNDYNTGAYLNWQLYPKHLSFIDGRNNSYDIKFLEDYFKIMDGDAPYKKIIDTQKINYFLLSHKANDTKIIIPELYRDPEWALVYFDELSVIFVKNTKVNEEIIKKHKIDFAARKNFDLDNVAINNEDDLFVAKNLRGEFFLNLGFYEEARYEFEKSLLLNQNNPATYNNLGISLQRLGDIDGALTAFLKAIALRGNFARAYFNAGNIYIKKEQWSEAAEKYERALRLDQNFADAYLNLGVIYSYHLIDLVKAKYFWEKYLKMYPDSPQVEAVQAEIKRLQTIR